MNGGWASEVRSVQPGGGAGAWLARIWGRARRAWLRRLHPHRVAALAAARTGDCPNCSHDVLDGRDLVWVRNVCRVDFLPSHTVSPFRDAFGLVRLGRPELALAALLGLGLAALGFWLLPPLAGLAVLPPAFACWFFRDPERPAPSSRDCVLAPADGVLDDVRQEASCPYFAGPALRLGIYLSLFDVHVQRAPVVGRVGACSFHRGARTRTVRRGHTDGNEHIATTFVTENGTPVAVRQIAGPFASRVCSVLRVGEQLRAGDRFGMVKFGSRCEVWLPAGSLAAVLPRLGSRVRAGVTVLGMLACVAGQAPVTSTRAAPSG